MRLFYYQEKWDEISLTYVLSLPHSSPVRKIIELIFEVRNITGIFK